MAMPALATTVSLDSFSVIRNGPLFFMDTFSDGLPPPVGPNGQGTYSATGTLQELGGRVRMDLVGAQSVVATGGGFITSESAYVSGFPLTNTDTFSVTGVFDLVVPDVNTERYGIRLREETQPLQSLLEVVVRKGADGITRVQFRNNNQVTGITSTFGSVILDPNHEQIGLTIARTKPSEQQRQCFVLLRR
jgi:hypothetical protein